MQPVDIIRTTQSEVVLQILSPCSTYWVVVTSVNCGLRISTSPQLLSLFNSSLFSISLCPGGDFSCSDWIVFNLTRKLADVENTLSSALASQCQLSNLTCFPNSSFTCSVNDNSAVFRYVCLHHSPCSMRM